jgi:PH domain
MSPLKLGIEAREKFDAALARPDRAGVLKKEKYGGSNKSYKNFFILKDNYLFYCKREGAGARGILNCEGCHVQRAERRITLVVPSSVSPTGKWANRTYHLWANSDEDAEAWVALLRMQGEKSSPSQGDAKAESSPSSDDTPAGSDGTSSKSFSSSSSSDDSSTESDSSTPTGSESRGNKSEESSSNSDDLSACASALGDSTASEETDSSEELGDDEVAVALSDGEVTEFAAAMSESEGGPLYLLTPKSRGWRERWFALRQKQLFYADCKGGNCRGVLKLDDAAVQPSSSSQMQFSVTPAPPHTVAQN